MMNYRHFDQVKPLNKEIWNKVNLNYIAKSITELMHEKLAEPEIVGREQDGLTHFRLSTDHEQISYSFSACHRALDYWHILKDTLIKYVDGVAVPLNNAPAFFTEMQHTFGIKPFTLAHFVEETLNTLYADAYIHEKGRLSAGQLADADYQTIEHQMDGHPWATINKGRIGFNHDDQGRYAPEAGQATQLAWLAVHQSRAAFKSLDTITAASFYEEELGAAQLEAFKDILRDKDLNPSDYLLIPVHEWQWNNKIVLQLAHDIASQYIVPLALGKDEYMCQQSIRTFFNISHPGKHYVKTAISILNTSIYRGLSPKKLAIAPRVTNWAKQMLDRDEYLRKTGVVLLGEVATASYTHPQYSAIPGSPYQYQEFLGVIWRESAENYLQPGERIQTMASLLYVDDAGESLVGAMIEKSGIGAAAWLKAYLRAYLKPVLRIFYKHAFFFSPHGENTILVMKDFIPQRIIIKDFVEEIVLTEESKATLPEDLVDVLREIDDELAPLFILSGIFDAVFRYLGNIFHTCVGYDEQHFWKAVADTILEFQEENPELEGKYAKFDLFVPEFTRVCINRVRLLTHGYSESTDVPVPEMIGTLINPVAMAMQETECLGSVRDGFDPMTD
ncbi:IucA/IucC family siderophore biosynthesis protein [Pedobacter sp. MC2016-15]|uniref:IucA/IucC family protein n=1 Tax=Pedobacter sp. MC2016-15 TaxID=2994473 RepID=UPI00224684F5|nr:IucA/IucC family siderophore biosynthesis protein [Pedobacter sp. MC2016-15]MCX2480320.1 IucA/IucC family siderophore biosynthesis protein [Pedobacter sp. MC2016-15]